MLGAEVQGVADQYDAREPARESLYQFAPKCAAAMPSALPDK